MAKRKGRAAREERVVLNLDQGLDVVATTVEEGIARGLGRVFRSFRAPEVDGDGFLCQAADGCTALTRRICMWCRRPFCRQHSEFVHKSGAYGLCLRCTRFFFTVGKRYHDSLGSGERQPSAAERAARESRDARASAEARHPGEPPPWIVLGVPEAADMAEVTAAFRALAKENHPDLAREPIERARREERFKVLSSAYEQMRERLERASSHGACVQGHRSCYARRVGFGARRVTRRGPWLASTVSASSR